VPVLPRPAPRRGGRGGHARRRRHAPAAAAGRRLRPGRDRDRAQAGGAARRARVPVRLPGQEKGKSLFLRTAAASLGREEANRLALPDDGVSKKHAEVRPVEAGGFLVVDVGSKNGVFVNDEQVKEKALEEGDVIGVGEARVFFGVV
jgi:pSer/pThr/pTyr-binding forkhead associated (FHA) protein